MEKVIQFLGLANEPTFGFEKYQRNHCTEGQEINGLKIKWSCTMPLRHVREIQV